MIDFELGVSASIDGVSSDAPFIEVFRAKKKMLSFVQEGVLVSSELLLLLLFKLLEPTRRRKHVGLRGWIRRRPNVC